MSYGGLWGRKTNRRQPRVTHLVPGELITWKSSKPEDRAVCTLCDQIHRESWLRLESSSCVDQGGGARGSAEMKSRKKNT